MTRRLVWCLAWAGFFAAAALAFEDAPQDKVAPPEQRVSRVSGPEARGAVEVSVALNPTNPDHIVAVSLQAGGKGQPYTSNYSYASTDGGKTWKTAPQHNPHSRVQGDDVVTFNADGLAIRTYISFEGIRVARPKKASTGIIVSTSRDGLEWSAPVGVVDHFNSVTPHEDKPWIRADTSKDSKHRGNIYVAWTKFDVYGSKDPEHKTHVYFSRSLDNGKSFAVPHRISTKPGDCLDSGNTLMGATPAVGPKGDVHVLWAGPEGLVLTSSTDGGYSFGKNRVIADTPGGWDFPIKGLGRCNGLPFLASDLSGGKHRGSLYAVWADQRNGDPDVFLTVSRDGGETWSKPQRVNDDAKGKDQFFPSVAVDPVDGAINIAYYDRGPLDGTSTGVTLSRSVDGGQTFQTHRLKMEPFLCEKLGFFGDYLGIDAHGGRVVVAYMHPVGATLGLSASVFDFEPGTQAGKKK